MNFWLALAGALLVAWPVHAQEAAAAKGYFPALPPSVRCTKELLPGTWKLLALYEVPAGAELAAYVTRPLQFYVFSADSRYGSYGGALSDIAPSEVKDAVFSQQKNIQQYVVNDAGMVFFYKDSIAIDSLACFIVAQDGGAFQRGQMLLMPPERAAKGRLVKIYQKIWAEPETGK